MKTKYGKKVDPFYIDHYERKDNNILTYYIDGHYRTEEYTKIKEREIISKKLEQLLDQVENLPIVKSEIVKNIIEELIAIVTTSGMCYVTSTCNFTIKDWQFILYIAGVTLGTFAMIYIGELLKENINEYKKLKKYSIYLDMKEQLERVKDSRLYHGVTQSEPLTVNTIDDYSLDEVRRVRKNMNIVKIIPFSKKEA